ncbi:MAG: hypothetical protein KDA32_07235 [Phycisphaerales bacterium]|nr:hypothetical protein [Phycisphaerales bacterium]
MAIGGLNLAAYPIVYGILGGDAHNGHRHVERAQTGEIVSTYFIRGHHLRSLAGREREVSRTVWVLSYAHSISLLLTSGAMVLAMLSFASPHILATMRGPRVRGQIFVGGLAVVVAVLSVGVAAFMIWDMTVQLMATPK